MGKLRVGGNKLEDWKGWEDAKMWNKKYIRG